MRFKLIENYLLRGIDAYLIARICGVSITTIIQSCERIAILRIIEELANIEFGSRGGNTETISLCKE